MKKYFAALLLLALLAFPAVVQAADSAKGTGFLTASQSVYLGPCQLSRLKVYTDGTNTATVIVYDGASASGTVASKIICTGASNFCGESWESITRGMANGIYISISGTGASAIVEYFTR